MKRRALLAMGVMVPVLALAACEPEPAPSEETVRPVKAMRLAEGVAFERVWFAGRAAATQEVDLSFRVGGSMVDRPVDVGATVVAGDVVARLDPSTFTADVRRIQAEVDQAVAERRRASSDLRRNRILAERGHISKAALDKFVSAANVAAATVEAQAAALRRAELSLSYTTLTAPFAGEIVRTYVENFQEVQPNQPVLRLVDKSRIEMTIDIPESLISLASAVEAVEVQFDPFPDLTLSAKIKEISAEASETTRTYPVTLVMDQPAGVTILPGMAGRASASADPRPAAERGIVTVPETAVFAATGGQESFVWVIDEAAMTVSKREVALFELTARGYTVKSGVGAGELIVIAGVNFLKDGQKVRLVDR